MADGGLRLGILTPKPRPTVPAATSGAGKGAVCSETVEVPNQRLAPDVTPVLARKRHKAEEIVAKLRQVDVLTSQGRPVAEAIRSIGVTEVTYYRWRSEYGGLKGDQVKRLKVLEGENARRRTVPDLTLEKVILKEAASGNW
jgi:putative transposase